MSEDQANSQEESQPTSENNGPIEKGHQPYKGYQPERANQQLVRDRFTGGYTPEISNLNPMNPPQGGSGVPPIEAESDDSPSSD